MTFNNRTPFSSIVDKNKHITSGSTDFMITRAPWANPVNKYYKLRKVRVSLTTTPVQSGVGDVVFWDQDLSSSTPSKRGSAGGALFVVPTVSPQASGAGNTASGDYGMVSEVDVTRMPAVRFYAGITCQAPINTHINLELEMV